MAGNQAAETASLLTARPMIVVRRPSYVVAITFNIFELAMAACTIVFGLFLMIDRTTNAMGFASSIKLNVKHLEEKVDSLDVALAIFVCGMVIIVVKIVIIHQTFVYEFSMVSNFVGSATSAIVFLIILLGSAYVYLDLREFPDDVNGVANERINSFVLVMKAVFNSSIPYWNGLHSGLLELHSTNPFSIVANWSVDCLAVPHKCIVPPFCTIIVLSEEDEQQKLDEYDTWLQSLTFYSEPCVYAIARKIEKQLFGSVIYSAAGFICSLAYLFRLLVWRLHR